jgi:hypothetical protein
LRGSSTHLTNHTLATGDGVRGEAIGP